jgi:tRNA threonylcarbamoyladenosine biosynthesis protein TsaE
VNVYRRSEGTSRRLYHLDAYRLSSAAEAEDLDLDLMIESGPMVVEWAERIQAVLPDEHLWIRMRYVDEEQRDLLFTARGQRYQKMLALIRRQLYGVV